MDFQNYAWKLSAQLASIFKLANKTPSSGFRDSTWRPYIMWPHQICPRKNKNWLYPWSFTWHPGPNLTPEIWKQVISVVVCRTSWLNLTTEKWKQVISAVTSQPAKQNFLHYIPAYHIISNSIYPQIVIYIISCLLCVLLTSICLFVILTLHI